MKLLKISRNKQTKLRVCCCCSMTFPWVVHVAPKASFASHDYGWILLSNSSFKRLIFHFTRTTEHQPTRNLHSYPQAFAVIFPPPGITTKFASTRTVNLRLFRCFAPPSRQICQLRYQAPVLHEVFRQLRVFQTSLWTNVAAVNIWIECKLSHVWTDSQTPPHI